MLSHGFLWYFQVFPWFLSPISIHAIRIRVRVRGSVWVSCGASCHWRAPPHWPSPKARWSSIPSWKLTGEWWQMAVSIVKGGTPKWIVYKGKSSWKWMITRGNPILGNLHLTHGIPMDNWEYSWDLTYWTSLIPKDLDWIRTIGVSRRNMVGYKCGFPCGVVLHNSRCIPKW